MPLRKLLLYGGCHALILRDLLAAHFGDRVAATLMINFQLIQSGQPFPYDELRNYDVVVYSPIENKGDYNTTHLVQACRSLGVDTICYPWLEWHGYCPGATKGEFKNRFQWRYPALAEAASRFDTFRTFVAWATEAFPDDAVIDSCLATSTAMVRSSEARHDMQVRISDYIEEGHRHSRLFLISDHPSLKLYLHVLRQILALIGVDDAGRCAKLDSIGEEPQWRWRTPIFPRVAKRLDLRFSDTRWIDDDVVPGRSLDLRSFLLLYYYPDSVILGPIGTAAIDPLPATGAQRNVDGTTRLVADRLGAREDRARDEYRLLEVLSSEPMPLERNQCFEIDSTQWRSAWG